MTALRHEWTTAAGDRLVITEALGGTVRLLLLDPLGEPA